MQYPLPSGSSGAVKSPLPSISNREDVVDISQHVAQSILTARYLLTSSAMEYLENQLPLAASLANLVCPRSLTSPVPPSGSSHRNSQTGTDEDEEDDEDTNEDLTASIMAHVASLGGRLSTSSKQTGPLPPDQVLLEKLSSSEQLMQLVEGLSPKFNPLHEFLSLRIKPLPDSDSFEGASANDFVRMLQSILLSPQHSPGSESALQVIRNFYLRHGHWHAAVDFLDSELCLLPGGIACDIPDVWLEAAALACQCPGQYNSMESLLQIMHNFVDSVHVLLKYLELCRTSVMRRCVKLILPKWTIQCHPIFLL